MSDLKLFRIVDGQATELAGASVTVEKSLQALLERNLETCLGVRFLATEYITGKAHGGRIDTLGIDENNSPVIIEYKRTRDENVINQGLFYLDWLMDHQGEFTLLVQKALGPEAADKVEWTSPRLLCIAGDYTKYDEHAVQQINRNIELLRYRWYEDGYLVLELVNAATGSSGASASTATGQPPKPQYKTVAEYYAQADPQLKDLFDSLENLLLGLGDDVTKKETKLYYAFRRLKNFASVEVHPQSRKLLVFVKVNPDEVVLEPGFTRDVRSIGHFGTGDLEITLSTPGDLAKAEQLLVASYDAS